MAASTRTFVTPGDVFGILRGHPLRWIVPTVVLTGAAVFYAAFRGETWEASQALVVRNEAGHGDARPGKFGQADEMKTTQETILELAKSRTVLEGALDVIGAPAGHTGIWPTADDVAALRDSLTITPPKGAEFGKTEVFYLQVKSDDRGRASALASAIVSQLQQRFQQLLDDKAASMIAELEKTLALTETDLVASSGKLGALERSVGKDLSELRMLNETPNGTSDLRQKVVEIETELRQAESSLRDTRLLSTLLVAAKADDAQLAALPNRLLESHVTLSRLIEGLNVARLRTANLLGSMSDNHPQVIAAKAEQAEVVKHLKSELTSAIQIARVESQLREAKVAALGQQLADAQGRLTHLASQRVEYSNLIAETKNHTALVEQARRQLADARSTQAAARGANLIARIDDPDTGTRPIGSGRVAIVMAGLGAGLMTGLGILFLTVGGPRGQADDENHAPAATTHRTNGHAKQTVESLLTANGGLSLKQALTKIAGGRN